MKSNNNDWSCYDSCEILTWSYLSGLCLIIDQSGGFITKNGTHVGFQLLPGKLSHRFDLLDLGDFIAHGCKQLPEVWLVWDQSLLANINVSNTDITIIK